MKFFVLTVIGLLSLSTNTQSQHTWQIFGGLDHSNIIHSRQGQQIVYAHTLNSPHWAFGWQIGAISLWKLSKSFDCSLGLKVQLKGDKDSVKFLGSSDAQDLRFIDLTVPLSLNYRLLEDKRIFFKIGLCGNILLKQKPIDNFGEFFPINTFKDELTLSGQVGVIFPISSRFGVELIYSEGFDAIYSKSYNIQGQTINWEYRHQVFELNLIYSL